MQMPELAFMVAVSNLGLLRAKPTNDIWHAPAEDSFRPPLGIFEVQSKAQLHSDFFAISLRLNAGTSTGIQTLHVRMLSMNLLFQSELDCLLCRLNMSSLSKSCHFFFNILSYLVCHCATIAK